MKSDSHNKTPGQLLAILFWLILWQFAASLANRSLLIPIPTPLTTGSAFLAMAGQMRFWLTVGASLLRICLGFAAALILGTVCALISARSDFFRILTSPLLQLIRAIPVASFTILVFLWVSREKIPSVISFLTVFPIVWANVESGARSMDRRFVELAQLFGMSRRDILRKILLPGIRPFFTAAIAGGMGFAWKSGVAAEVICRTANSIGDLLWSSKSVVAYDEVFAETLVIVLLSTVLQMAAGKLLSAGSGVRKADQGTESMVPKTADASSLSASAVQAKSLQPTTLPEQSFIDLDHITFGYPHRKNLYTDYSLSIPAGSRLCLSGPSGIGKSTLIRLICGLEVPTSGTVRHSENCAFSAVLQEDLLIPHLTVLQNVTLFAPGHEAEAASLLSELGLGEFLNALPSELSGGMKRRAALARALCHTFDVLVLDEAFTGLDETAKQRCFQVIRTAVQGKILILASHDPAEAEALGAKTIRFRSIS